jgi:RHS repeat-associated protein
MATLVTETWAANANGDTDGAGLLGSLPKVVSVDPTMGAAAMTYAFEVPPGRAGLQPQLVLSYNSGASEPSPYGRGWFLSLPSIQRSTRFGQPKFTWTDTFVLQWNGGTNDLVQTSDQTVGGVGMREFRTIIESFMRIRSFTDTSYFTYWEVWDGQGRKYQFGRANGYGISPQVDYSLWALNRIEDAHGNYLTMTWTNDTKVLYPKEIQYTGNSISGMTPANRVEFAYEGRYDVSAGNLGYKDDSSSRREIRNRLLRLKTWAGTQVASVYFFDYSTPSTGVHDDLCGGVSCGQTTMTCPNGSSASCSNTCHPDTGFCVPCEPQCDTGGGGGGGGGCEPRCQEGPSPLTPDPTTPVGPSLLTEIKRWDVNGTTSLPATKFEYTADMIAQKHWSDPPTGLLPVGFLSKDDTATERSTFDYGVQIEDVNRDGLPDLVQALGYTCSGAPPRRTFLNTGSVWVEAGTALVPPVDLVMRDCDHGQYDPGVRLVDINGDHLPDFVSAYTWNNGPLVTRVWINTGASWRDPLPGETWNVPVPFVHVETSGQHGRQSEDLGVRFADVDGDGWVDLLVGRTTSSQGCNGDDRRVFLNNRSTGWDATVSSGWRPPVAFVHKYCGGGTIDPGVRLVDINSDGLTDVIQSTLWDGVPRKNIWMGNGRPSWDGTLWRLTSSDIPQYFTIANGSNTDSDDMGVRFGDVNGDGRVDLIVARLWYGTGTSCTNFSAGGGNTCKAVYVQRADQGWVEDPEWSAVIPSGYVFIEHKPNYEDYDDGVRLADVDGNGTVDFLRGLDGWGGGPHEWRRSNASLSDLLSKIDSSTGGTTTIEYRSSLSSHYVSPWDVPPLRLTDVLFPLVSSVTTSDGQPGVGHTYSTTYLYADGYFHYPRREFRGFHTVKQFLAGSRWHIERENVSAVTDVAPLAGAARVVQLKDASNRILYQITNTYDTSDNGPPTYLHFLTGTTEEYWDFPPGGGPSIKRTVKTDFINVLASGTDPFILARTVRRYGATAAEDFDVTEEYLNDSTTWRIGLPKRQITADFHSDPAAPLTQTWFYYDGLDWGIVGSKGDLRKVETWSGLAADGRGADRNRVTTTDYDTSGNITLTVDGAGHTQTVEYGITDSTRTFPERITVQTNDGSGPVSHVRTYRYDPRFGVRTQVTTAGDGLVSYEYDLFGRITKYWNAHDSQSLPTVCFQYSPSLAGLAMYTFQRERSGIGESCGTNGMLANVTFHDGLGRFLQEQRETEGANTVDMGGTVAYDSEGFVESVTLPYRTTGNLFPRVTPPAGTPKTSYLYDQLGRRTQASLPGSPSARIVTNNYLGWTVQTFDPQSYKTEVDLDPFGRVRKRRTYNKPADGGGLYATVSMDFDRLGRLRFITDPSNRQIEHQYNGFGEKTTTIDPDSGTTGFEYYKDGLLSKFTDAAGQDTTYAYDALHRVLHEEHTDGTRTEYHYDEQAGRPLGARPIGHLTSVDGTPTGVRQEMTYDDIGRLIVSSERVDGQFRSIRFDLDAMGRPERLTYPDNFVLAYTYQPDGHTGMVGSQATAGLFASDADYTAWGNVSHVTLGNGLGVTYQYNPVTAWLDGIDACFHCGQANEVKIVDSSFGRDLSGHVTSVFDGVNGANQTFVLDNLYRLKTATAPSGYGSLTFQHDTLGNLGEKDSTTYYHDVPGRPHHMSHASDGRTFQYDLNGNLEWILDSEGRGRHYIYDARQQVIGVSDAITGVQASNVFNPQGRRVRRTVVDGGDAQTTVFVSNLYEETGSVTRKHIYMEGQRIAEVVTDASAGTQHIYYLVADQVGSLQVMTAENGTVAQRIRYKPFGEISSVQAQDMSLAFGFAGSRPDDGTGLNDYGARFYDPALGRFLSVDPLLADPLNLMDLNPYGYAHANPVSFVDIGGLSTDACAGEDWCDSVYVSIRNSGGQRHETTFSFVWSGSIDFGGLWGAMRGAFSGLGNGIQRGFYSLRDGVRGVNLGGGNHGFGGASGGQVNRPGLSGGGAISGTPGEMSVGLPAGSDIDGGTVEQRYIVEQARRALDESVNCGATDQMKTLEQDIHENLQPGKGPTWHLVKTIPKHNGAKGFTPWSDPDNIYLDVDYLDPGQGTELLMLHELGHRALYKTSPFWQYKIFFGWKPWGAVLDKQINELQRSGQIPAETDPMGYAMELLQVGHVVTYP